jgi:hypothetical protein
MPRCATSGMSRRRCGSSGHTRRNARSGTGLRRRSRSKSSRCRTKPVTRPSRTEPSATPVPAATSACRSMRSSMWRRTTSETTSACGRSRPRGRGTGAADLASAAPSAVASPLSMRAANSRRAASHSRGKRSLSSVSDGRDRRSSATSCGLRSRRVPDKGSPASGADGAPEWRIGAIAGVLEAGASRAPW